MRTDSYRPNLEVPLGDSRPSTTTGVQLVQSRDLGRPAASDRKGLNGLSNSMQAWASWGLLALAIQLIGSNIAAGDGPFVFVSPPGLGEPCKHAHWMLGVVLHLAR